MRTSADLHECGHAARRKQAHHREETRNPARDRFQVPIGRPVGVRLARQRSFAICFGRKKFQIGMNQPPIDHQVAKRSLATPSAGRRGDTHVGTNG